MTLARRLVVLLAIPVLTLLVVGVIGHSGLATVEERSRFVAESRIVALATIGKLSRSFERLRVEVRTYVLATTPELREESRRRFDDTEQEVIRLLDAYAAELLFSEEGRQLLGEFRTLSQEWRAGARQVFDLQDAGDGASAIAYLSGPLTTLAEQLETVSDRWISNNERLAADAGRDVTNFIASFRTRMDGAIAVAALFSAFFGYLTFIRTARPIRSLEASVRSVAAGDFATEVPFTTQQDEIGGLARSLQFLKGAAAQADHLLRQTQAQEAELRRVNAQADTALDLTKAGYWHVPLDGSGWYTSSPRAVAIYGDPPSEGHAYSLDHWAAQVKAADPVVGQVAFDSFAAAVEGRVPRYDAVYLYKRPVDGRVVWIHALGHIVRTPEGVATDIFGVAQDVTDVKLAQLAQQASEDRVRATEQFYRSVLELAPDAMMVVDATGSIRLANKQTEVLFGYGREELIGQSVEMLVPEDIRERHAGLRADFHHVPAMRAMGKGRELQGRHKTGSLVPIEIGLSPLPADDEGRDRVAVSVRDVTERKEQERAIRTAQKKAEEATEMKSLFLANMSHEIRTPMNAIIGLSHLALATALTPKQRDYIAKVHNAGTSLLGIINDILDFSKIEAGRLDLEERDFRLDDVIGMVTTVTGHKATEKGLELLVQVPTDVPQFLRGDSLRLGQVLTNLVNNSVKFTAQGEVRVTTELLEQTGDKCHLRFSVSDSGIGITREQAERLFQPFMQADMSTTRRHGGTGLGLTICRRLVELMGGQIWMKSEPGAGSTFTFTAWLGIGSEVARRVIPERITRLRALIVDDNAAAREILDDLLADVVLERDAVSSGEEALAAIRSRDGQLPYDVVFMDWRMPGLDGLETSRQIRENRSLVHSPAIIMVTAFGREDLRDEAERARLDGFLVKPVTKSTLIDALVSVYVDDRDQQVAVTMAARTGVDLTGVRILLVEDNDINQQIASELLTGVGASVDIVSNGQEAVERLHQSDSPPPFDVVLMDLQMPVMDGHEATAIIRGDVRTASLPVIAMTAHATIEERQRCLEAGMDGHIAKPVDPGLLFDTVARYRPAAESRGAQQRQVDADIPVPSLRLVDVEEGLGRVAGNRKLYVSVLRQFLDRQAGATEAIRQAHHNGDTATARRIAHTLKGLGGSIGATAVQTSAGALEQLLRDGAPGDHIEDAIAHLSRALSPVIAELRAAFGDGDRGGMAAAGVPAAETAALVAEAARLLDDYDAAVMDFVEANGSRLRPAFDQAEWQAFVSHVNAFAFAEARLALEPVLKRSAART